jgi:hypothetical protein
MDAHILRILLPFLAPMIIMIIMMTGGGDLYIDMESEPRCGPGTPRLHSVLNLLVVMENAQNPSHMQTAYANLSVVEMFGADHSGRAA